MPDNNLFPGEEATRSKFKAPPPLREILVDALLRKRRGCL